MRLLSLALSNFKGARSVEIRPEGADLNLFGDNAAGKTTLADAWFWLLFGKDSHNRSDFEIKTLDHSGKAIPMLDHAVEADLRTETGRLTLRKVYKETYTKKRGAPIAEFTGHTTEYFVNTVPVSKGEYDARVADICSESRFRVLTDPTYLVETMRWQDRRKALMELVGDVTDAEVIASKPELRELPAILGDHSIDDHRKILGGTRKRINDELLSLPARIDEADRALPAVRETGPEDVDSLRADLRRLQNERAGVAAGGAVADLAVRIKSIEAEMIAIANELRSKGDPARESALADLRAQDEKIGEAESAVRGLQSRLRLEREELARVEPRLIRLRGQAAAEKAKGFTGEEACPSCGQPLPPERVQAAIEEFNAGRAARLADIVSEGKAVSRRFDEVKASIASLIEEEDAADLVLTALRGDRALIEVPAPSTPDVVSDRRYAAKAKEKADAEARIERLRSDATETLAGFDRRIAVVQGAIGAAESASAVASQREAGLARIAELRAREKDLAREFERLERELFLTEEFVRAKVAMLTERINGRFEVARFKLFEEQVNGGLTECCEVTMGGVPYGSLNHGSRVNVGLDVIDALAAHGGFAPPVFVDNAESVTAIRPTLGQQIRLVVSAPDKTLRAEFVRRADEPPPDVAPTAKAGASQAPHEALF